MPEFTTPFLSLILWAGIGYLIGSIPFGVLITRAFGMGDVRQIGSGNIGATNVLRTGNKLAAFLTLLLDGAKGAVALLLARHFAGEDAAQLAGFAAFLGHCFPVWLNFRGGKGVATFVGLMLALHWPLGVGVCIAWLLTALISRISSLSAIMAAMFAPILTLAIGYDQAFVLTIALMLVILWRHKANIARMIAGTEPKIGKSKS